MQPDAFISDFGMGCATLAAAVAPAGRMVLIPERGDRHLAGRCENCRVFTLVTSVSARMTDPERADFCLSKVAPPRNLPREGPVPQGRHRRSRLTERSQDPQHQPAGLQSCRGITHAPGFSARPPGASPQIVGFDAIPDCAQVFPSLSSIRCDIAGFGRQMAEMVLNWLEKDHRRHPETATAVILIPCVSSQG